MEKTLQDRTKSGRPDLQRRLKLTPYNDVEAKIVAAFSGIKPSVEEVPADLVLGRVCSGDVSSKFSVPSTTVSAMDGYAIRSVESQKASTLIPVRFKILGSVFPASDATGLRITGNECFYVATGATLPNGADAVVKVEDTKFAGSEMTVTRPIANLKNVVERGEDFEAGRTLFRKGHVFNSADVALLISAGVSSVRVFHSPLVGILSIGDELREFRQRKADSNLENQNIIVNNFFNLISGLLGELGIQAKLIGICKDDSNEITKSIESHIGNYDAILTIGGSSVGEKDFTPDALSAAIGSRIIFHGVRMVPIKPAGLFTVNNKPVVVIPSHASSAAFSFFLIALPVLNIISGLEFNDRKLRLDATCVEQIENTRPIDAIALVSLARKDGAYHVMHLGWGSNVISNLSLANGFVIMNRNSTIQKSERVEIQLLGTSQLARILQS